MLKILIRITTNKYPKHMVHVGIKYNVLAYILLTVTSWSKVSSKSDYHYNDFIVVSSVGIKGLTTCSMEIFTQKLACFSCFIDISPSS